MQYLKNLGIGQKLIAGIIGLLVITSTAIGTLSFVQSSGALQEQVEENIPLMAQDGARLVNSYIQRYRIAVEGVAARDVIESMAGPGSARHWRRRRSAWKFWGWALFPRTAKHATLTDPPRSWVTGIISGRP